MHCFQKTISEYKFKKNQQLVNDKHLKFLYVMKIFVLMSIKNKRIHSGRELIRICPVILSLQKN